MVSLTLTTCSFLCRSVLRSFVVVVVGVGDDGVETVVAAGQLDDDEDGVLAGLGGVGGVDQELRHGGSQRQQRGAFQGARQKLSAIEHMRKPPIV